MPAANAVFAASAEFDLSLTMRHRSRSKEGNRQFEPGPFVRKELLLINSTQLAISSPHSTLDIHRQDPFAFSMIAQTWGRLKGKYMPVDISAYQQN